MIHMDIDNDINQVLSPIKVAKDSDRQVHVCTSTVQNTTCTSSKTVPFFPRVLLSVQQPLSGLINQTILQPTGLTSSSVSGINTPQSHISSLPMSATSVSSPINTTSQFFPLILAATSAMHAPTSSTGTPLQLHLSSYSTSNSVTSSSQGIFLQANTATAASCLPIPNVIHNPRPNPSVVTSAPTSTALVASLIGKTCSTPPSVASVVISPQASSHIQPTLALRFASRTPSHCGTAVTATATNASSCPLVFEPSSTSTTTSSQSQRSHCLTALNFPTPASCVSGSLLMSSALCSTSRVLIHKPQNVSHSSLIENLTSSVLTSTNKISLSSDPNSGCITSVSLSNSTIVLHDQASSHSAQVSKAKLVNFSTPLSATVRLITPPSTVCTTAKSTCSVSSSGANVVSFSASLPQTGMLTSRPSVTSTGSVWSGLTVNPNVSIVSAPTGNVVTIQSSQSLIVQAPSDISGQSTITNSSSLNPSLMMSLRSLPGSSSTAGPTLPLSAANHTVLAFNLANSSVHSPTTSTNATGMFTNPVRQLNPCNSTSPLIVRASGPSAVGYIPSTSSASVGPASLLKSFNLSSGSTGSSVTTSNTPVMPHILPVNIAPSKLTPLQPSVTISSTSSVSHTRSNFSQNTSVCVSSHRLPTSSIFSQPSRKRARKQQLASSFSSVMVTPVSVVSSTTASTSVSMNSITNSCTLSSVVSGCRSVLPSTTTLVAMAKPNIQPHHFTQPACSNQVTHSPQISGNSIRSSVAAVDSVYRNTSTAISSVSCSTNVSTSNSSGLMGLRLVSPSSAGSFGTRVCTADSSLIMVTSPSHTVSSGGHLRTSNSHCSQASDIQQTQAAAVYVLTTSVYPILSTTTVTPSNSSTVIEPACSASSSLSSVAVSGATNNILQVRFKHSPPPNTSSVVLPEIQESKIQSTPTPNNLPTNPCPVSDIPKSIVSEDPKFHTVLHAGKSYRSSESNSLLHHLVSTLKQCHQVDSTTTTTPTATTVTTTITTTTDVYHFNNNNNNTDFIKKSNFPSTSLELSSPAAATTTTNLCLATDLEDVKQSKSLNSLESNEKRNLFDLIKDNSNSEKYFHQSIDDYHENDNTDDDDNNNNNNNSGNDKTKAVALPTTNTITTATHSSSVLPLRKKRTKNDLEVDTEQQVNESLSTGIDNHHNNKTSKTGILWAVDPIDGCEWILHNRPPRPSIIPKYASSNSRLGGAYRSKTTHFLNLSEVSVKSPSKRANTYESSRRAGSYSTRRRRRSLITGSRMDSVNQKKGSKDSESLDGLNDSEESNAAKRLVQDILALRSEQKESGFLRFPLTETSMLNTSGWRAFRCLDNLDLLAYTELQTLQTVENIGTDLERQLDCINSEAAPLFSRNSWFYSVPTDSVNIAGGSQSLAAKKLSLAIQLNRAMEYVRGISQRKRCMLDSLQRMSSVTKNLITHFSLSINQIIEELERSANNSSKSLSPSSSSKTNLDSNTVSNSLNLRRSCRKHSPNNTSTNVRQVRRRSTAAGSSTSSSKHSASLIKNSSNTCPGTSSQGPICNGESSNYSILR
uniref:Uncharacterized protein n=1 Tax=Trichobilharzia regenti TaxID=157069 RepID=A0AA85JM52_TRIRE|nr:unnamed protein product [Trichobilharzia regenti]